VKLLLDTQCWLWWFAQPERLNEEAISRIADETNELWFSVASIWEIGIKVAIGTSPRRMSDRTMLCCFLHHCY
jgi:PIN domain nuclease of toxin-antitoxin system